MKRSHTIAIIVSLLLVALLNVDTILSLITVRKYCLITECVIENISNRDLFITPSSILNFYLIPTIEGWQKVEKIKVVVNGKALQKYSIKEVDGNKIIEFPLFRLKPGEKLNVTVFQEVTVYRFVFPGFKREVRGLSNGFQHPLPSSKFTKLNNFYKKGNFSKVVQLIEKVYGDDKEILLHCIELILNKIKYSNSSYGITPPAATLERGYGSCGDISALLVAMLRAKHIPAYICFSYVYEEGLKVSERTPVLSVEYRNLGPHAFVMVYLDSVGWVPVDIVIHAGNRPQDCVESAGININERLIVYGRAIEMDPNIFLIIAPEDGTKVSVTYEGVPMPIEIDYTKIFYSLMMGVLIGYIVYLVLESESSYKSFLEK